MQDTQTITFAPPGSALAGVAVPLTATASSGLRVAFGSGTQEVCTVTGSTVTTLTAGTCTITATQGGDADYAPAPNVTQSLHVQATQMITFAQPGGAAAGTKVTLTATATSGLPVTFRSGTPEALHGHRIQPSPRWPQAPAPSLLPRTATPTTRPPPPWPAQSRSTPGPSRRRIAFSAARRGSWPGDGLC